LQEVKQRWSDEGGRDEDLEKWDDLARAFENFCEVVNISEPYEGTRLQRLGLRSLTSAQIGKYISATKLQESEMDCLEIEDDIENEVKMLKELTWHYVIKNPSLASMQYGQRKIIRELMFVYLDAANRSSPAWAIFPHRFQQEMKDLSATYGNDIPHDLRVRTAADAVATMTDLEALRIYQRFSGVLPGSVLEPLVR